MSEVADALQGFLEPPPLPLDTLFEAPSFEAPPCNAYFQETCFFSQHVPKGQQQPLPLFVSDILRFCPQPRGALSAQSAAARERRKRISEKMSQLSRLVPGGTRMSTAEMLHSAHKYVKFLQVQVGILDLMSHIPESESAKAEHLRELLTSSAVQEKLSREGMCIVPQEIVDDVAAVSEIKSKPLISASCSVY